MKSLLGISITVQPTRNDPSMEVAVRTIDTF
jgi:hypothetical protein